MTNDERMTKSEGGNARIQDSSFGRAQGSARASRADFGALAEISSLPTTTVTRKVCDHGGVIASTQRAYASL